MIDGQINSQAQTVAQTRLPIEMTGDPRFGIPAGAILAQRNFAEAKAALAPVIADAPIEITIVGDIDEAAAIAAVLQSFGALGERKLAAQPSPAARAVAFRSDRSSFLLKHDGPADQAMVETLWPTTDDSNYREVVGLEMLKDVLELMLMESVRETLGSSYAVQMQSVNSTAYTGFGYIAAAAVVAPDKADEVEKAFAEAAAELRDKPIPADLLARARAPRARRRRPRPARQRLLACLPCPGAERARAARAHSSVSLDPRIDRRSRAAGLGQEISGRR